MDIYHSNQNQKENCKILVINHKKWKLKDKKKAGKSGCPFCQQTKHQPFLALKYYENG
jgi:formate dehydrogenase assembly factor FdhD